MPENLVTIKVKKHVYDAILELQAMLIIIDHKKYSNSDIIEYALSKVPDLQAQLGPRFKIIQPSEKRK